MTTQIINKVQKFVVGLAIVGATVFTAAPMDGCNGEFKVLVDTIGSDSLDFGDDSDSGLDVLGWSTDDESGFWSNTPDELYGATPISIP